MSVVGAAAGLARFDVEAAAVATRRRIFELAASERIPVTGYHMPHPAMGFIDRQGSAWRWVPSGLRSSL